MRWYKFQTKGQWGEDIIRTEGKATYYLSLIRGGTYFGLQKLFRMISSCGPKVLYSPNFFKNGEQRIVGPKNLWNIE